jgi:F0F1-type ATP synthase assembly protein I
VYKKLSFESMGYTDTEKQNNEPKAWWVPALIGFARMSAWIVPPVIIGAMLGSWLGKRFGHPQLFLLVCMGLSFGVSIIGVAREANLQFKQIEKENGQNKLKSKENK